MVGAGTTILPFLSTLSLRRATIVSCNYFPFDIAISIHALLAESDACQPSQVYQASISIHALLAESDGVISSTFLLCCNFYPRSPCGERPVSISRSGGFTPFLSTLSLRRATGCFIEYIHNAEISIHALLAESDFKPVVSVSITTFLSTLSLRRATVPVMGAPHRPQFLSTLSLRRATIARRLQGWHKPISIHALLAESDSCSWGSCQCHRHFYPRSPCGERP